MLKISVVVPIYNIESYLERCIESICHQTYKKLQIILVNDGSSDSCEDIVRKWQLVDERIICITKSNGGLVSARKAGVRLADGDYITFVDGDDWIDDDWIEKFTKVIGDDSVDMVCGGNYVNYTSGVIKENRNRFDTGAYDSNNIIPNMIHGKDGTEFLITQFVWSKLFKKNLIKDVIEIVPESISTGEDVAITYNCILKSKKVYVTNELGYHYMKREDSMCAVYPKDERRRCNDLINFLRKRFSEDVQAKVLLPQLNWYEKMIRLTRDISYFDESKCEILSIMGGLKIPCDVVIYGAGAMGKCLLNYLQNISGVKISGWLDREKNEICASGIKIEDPETYEYKKFSDRYYVIAIVNTETVKRIREFLANNGVGRNKIISIPEEFFYAEST